MNDPTRTYADRWYLGDPCIEFVGCIATVTQPGITVWTPQFRLLDFFHKKHYNNKGRPDSG